MAYATDMPPHRSAQPIEAPPPSDRPTTAQLKADIDSGATGDKVAVFDPGLSPLGTDDEAGGTPNSPARVRLARALETGRNVAARVRTAAAGGGPDRVQLAYGGLIGVIAVAIIGGLVLGRP